MNSKLNFDCEIKLYLGSIKTSENFGAFGFKVCGGFIYTL